MNDKQLHAFLNYYEENDYLQGNLLIWHKGNLLHNKSYGLASIEQNVLNDQTKRFKIASLTKAFTAMLVLSLHEKGVLNIYDSVVNYFPYLEKYKEVTLYHCLTCTSGIPDFMSTPDYWEKEMRIPHEIMDIIKKMYQEELHFQPVTAYEYSSTGYLIVTKIIENITGFSYESALKKFILDPLGMKDTGCINQVDIVPNLVDSYNFWVNDIQAPKTDMSFPTGAAGMFSTVTDLLSWGKAIIEKKILSEELYQLYETTNQETYACGWDVTTINGKKVLQHQGDLDGFVTSSKICREEQLVVIFLSNQEIIPVTTITKRIVEHLFGRSYLVSYLETAQIAKEILATLANKYRYVDSNSLTEKEIELCLEGEQLFLCCNKRYDSLYKFRMNSFYDANRNIVLKAEKIDEQIIFSSNKLPIYTMLTGKQVTLYR